MANMTIQKSNPYTAVITITSSGTAYNLTGKTVLFTVKALNDNADNDTSALITKSITSHTDATGGITTLDLTGTQTNIAAGTYKYDIRIYASGIQMNSETGYCYITDIVTKRTS